MCPALRSAVATPLVRGFADAPLHIINGSGFPSDYAERLLASMGLSVERTYQTTDDHPAIAWAQSGAMSLTGCADGPPQMCPFPLASCVDGALAAFDAVAGITMGDKLSPAILSERAGLAGLWRNGAASASGYSRLLRASDDWIAVTLGRQADWELVPAWLDGDSADTWVDLATLISRHSAEELIERGHLLGLATALVNQPDRCPAPWYEIVAAGNPANPTDIPQSPLVIDLSSLWAGPLCTHLLQRAGARVIKVESLQRPDGARLGAANFFDLLNGGKMSVALDFTAPSGIDQLRQLLCKADIVIEASRPRALRQLGIDSQAILAERKGLTWLSITGHGWTDPQGNWIAYGDDAGAAAGLSGALLALTGKPMFCGDAIADPIAGAHAALLAMLNYHTGGGRQLAVSLRDVLSNCISFAMPSCEQSLRERWLDWQRVAQDAGIPDRLPDPRNAKNRARTLGADTHAVFEACGIKC